MRTIIDLPEDLIEDLAIIGEKNNKSRSALIREAVTMYVAEQKPLAMKEAFGIWADRNIDALEYERKIREEWEVKPESEE